jgi:hypothetical protein
MLADIAAEHGVPIDLHMEAVPEDMALPAGLKSPPNPPQLHANIAALQSHFASDGLEFTAPSPDRWYVRMPAGEAPRTTPLAEAKGRNVFGLLPADGRWRSAMTEAQMILSSPR